MRELLKLPLGGRSLLDISCYDYCQKSSAGDIFEEPFSFEKIMQFLEHENSGEVWSDNGIQRILKTLASMGFASPSNKSTTTTRSRPTRTTSSNDTTVP